MDGRPCPSHDELADYLAERLAEEVAARIRTHLDACAECRGALETLAAARRPPSMSAADVPALESFGEYRLVEKLGAGGMGTVYKAWHTELERMVALKVLSKDLMHDESAVARFRREMKAVGRFDHPNIVRAHDAREIDGTYFLVMEYVDGMDLSELVARTGPLPVADACELVRRAACGLQCAGECGLVHRDVKPSNLILGADGQLKILDLGLARIHAVQPAAEAMTAVGQVMGTPDFMAPEQVNDSHAVDIRADVYSLGCTLYMLLAGHPPFVGSQYGTAFEKMVAHTRDSIPPIRSIRPEVPKRLAAVTEQALAKPVDERPATPARLAESLEPFTEGADPVALLARARQSVGDGASADTAAVAAGTGNAATTAPTHDLPVRPSARAVRRRAGRPGILAASVLVLLALAALVFITARRRNDLAQADGTAAADAEEDGATAGSVGADRTVRSGAQPDTNRPPVSSSVVPAELPGWIVLSWTRQGLGLPSLWLISPDGRRHVPVTHSRDRLDVQPSFSPDGRRIAFVRGEGPGSPTSVWTCNVDGSQLQELVGAREDGERLVSPIWVSNSRVFYTRNPQADRSVEMEVWQVDLADKRPERVFGFDKQLGMGEGLATDVSVDRRELVVTAQTRAVPPSTGVYLTDLSGNLLHTLCTGRVANRKNVRAIRSPDGRQIAWCRYFASGSSALEVRFGVGLARLDEAGRWTTRQQSEDEPRTTPLAWSPEGRFLLCGRIEQGDSPLAPAALFLLDDQLRPAGELFELKVTTWGARSRDFGRLADWAVVPDDALPQGLQKFEPLP